MVLDLAGTMKRCLRTDDWDHAPITTRLLRSWHQIVTEFTLRSLTHNSDKFPAVSGLANIIHQRTGFQYLAGLWDGDMPAALLWLTKDETASRTRGPWRSPSWSWASIDGPVTSQGLRVDARALKHIEEEASILSHNFTLLTSDPFGQIQSGIIRLRARRKVLKRGSLDSHYKDFGWKKNLGTAFAVLDGTKKSIGAVYFDTFLRRHLMSSNA